MEIMIVYLYLLIGIISIVLKKPLPRTYIVVLVFMLFKIITDYRLCTLSYLEYKIRGVTRNEGYLNQFLDPIIDLRDTKHFYYIIVLSFIILYYDLIVLNNSKGFLTIIKKEFKKINTFYFKK